MTHKKKLFAGGVAVLLLCAFALTGMGAASPANLASEEAFDRVAVYAAAGDSIFTDIPSGAPYEDAVNWCYENGLMNGKGIVYVNVMNRLSIDCDCDGNPAEPDIHDIGILASTDPVALDQACVDLIYAAEGNDSLVRRIESRNGLHTLEHAEEIGLGSRAYELVSMN